MENEKWEKAFETATKLGGDAAFCVVIDSLYVAEHFENAKDLATAITHYEVCVALLFFRFTI